MTVEKRLNEIFDIEEDEETEEITEESSEDESLSEDMKKLENIFLEKMKNVKSDEILFSDLEKIKEKAMDAFEKLLELGIDAEPKTAEQYLKPAVDALNIAMTSESNKISKYIELKRLELSKKKLAIDERRLKLYELKEGFQEIESDTNLVTENRNKILQEIKKLMVHKENDISGKDKDENK